MVGGFIPGVCADLGAFPSFWLDSVLSRSSVTLTDVRCHDGELV